MVRINSNTKFKPKAKYSSRSKFLDFLDSASLMGMQTGAVVFALAAGYLLYGIFSGHLGDVQSADRMRTFNNVMFVCKFLKAGGILLTVSAAARFYNEEVLGYILMFGGAAICWGIPFLVGMQQAVDPSTPFPILIVKEFVLVGIVALVLCPPFIIYDQWTKLTAHRSTQHGTVIAPVSDASKEEEVFDGSSLYICLNCWQSVYCRPHLRKFCLAYEHKKPCWRIKSGCYCDEDMILRTLQGGTAAGAARADSGSAGTTIKPKDATPAQKRARCRQCFLYGEHQKQKYRILGPLVFPIAGVIIWFYHMPAKLLLDSAVSRLTKLAGQLSFTATSAGANGAHELSKSPLVSDSVEWIFLSCLALIMTTYMLRGLEYLIFELQI